MKSWSLHDYLSYIANNYDRSEGLDSDTQTLIKGADEALSGYTPTSINIKGAGGKGLATYTPMLGFFCGENTYQNGIYVVYIFSEDLKTISLTLNQGQEDIRKLLGSKQAQKKLQEIASRVRKNYAKELISGLDEKIVLNSNGDRQKNYEAGNIVAIKYDCDDLPKDSVLAYDLNRFIELYLQALESYSKIFVGGVEPDVEDATAAIEEIARPNKPISQGRGLTHAQRVCIENHSMEMARSYLLKQGWKTVKDTSSRKSYDFDCSGPLGRLYVEVKGTTSLGHKVILTRNEVSHHRKHHPHTALIIVSEILLTGDKKDNASGGKLKVIMPWTIGDKDLTVISYYYDTES